MPSCFISVGWSVEETCKFIYIYIFFGGILEGLIFLGLAVVWLALADLLLE